MTRHRLHRCLVSSLRRLALVACALAPLSCQHAGTFVRPALTECGDGALERPLRVVSYNIRAGLSSSLYEVANVIQEMDPDVLALQEVDRDVMRSGSVDQAQYLADTLGYHYAFAAAIRRDGGEYGVALFSRLPFQRAERVQLSAPVSNEPRVAIDATVCAGNKPLRVLAVHADVWPWSGTQHARELSEYVEPSVGQGVIVAGDLNATPDWPGPAALRHAGLNDLIAEFGGGSTFVGDPLKRRLDYIFVDGPLRARARAAGVINRRASDHLPIFAEIDLTQGW
ncbi:MAG: endonuclease/exonuclease/phosphatase family protein [Myxococcota bacterium]